MSLTPDQLKKIEENRLAAIKRRQEKQKCSLSELMKPKTDKCSDKNIPIQLNHLNKNDQCNENISNFTKTVVKSSSNISTGSVKTNTNKTDIKKFFSGTTPSVVGAAQNNSSEKQNCDDIVPNEDVSKVLLSNYTTGACYLISQNRFAIEVPYKQQIIDSFKAVPGRMYDGKTRNWNFPLTQYKDLMKNINQFKPEVTVTPLPQFILKAFVSKNGVAVSHNSIDISCISKELRNQLYQFQIEGIQFAISKNGRCLIADEMGLGKTVQALGVADYYKSDWPILIVCPSSMRYQWEEEVQKFIPNIPLHQIFVMKSSKDYIDEDLVKVLIVSYDLLGKRSNFIKQLKFGVVIIDESHSLKSLKTQRTKAALDIIKSISRIILLSGTPALSRPSELFTQLAAIDNTTFKSFKEYGVRYCNGQLTRFGWDFSGSSNMDELKLLLESKYMIRRLKKDVIAQLPSKIRQVVILSSDDITCQSQSMKAYAKNLKLSSLKGMERRGQLLSYFAETGQSKLKAICDYVTKLLEEGKKFLCFAHHLNVLDGICETVQKCEREYIRIDGKVSAEDRKMLCDKFQYDDKYRVAVLSIKAANTGLTLTAAQLVVFAELFWNPGELVQAEDRVHRIGQQDSVLIQYLLAKNTADDYLWPLIQDKLDVLTKAGLTKDTFANSGITSCYAKSEQKQKEITDFYKNNEELDEENLSKLMDDFECSANKKIKLM